MPLLCQVAPGPRLTDPELAMVMAVVGSVETIAWFEIVMVSSVSVSELIVV